MPQLNNPRNKARDSRGVDLKSTVVLNQLGFFSESGV